MASFDAGDYEHHLMNCLMMPALQFAVKIAAHTEQIKIITAITILPIRDMRVFAGEVVVADIFTEGGFCLVSGAAISPMKWNGSASR